MTDVALTELERLGAFDEAERTFQMTEEAFRAFYEETARPVWLYLARMTGDGRLADDLLQESYYRFLRANATFSSDDHRRHYLFRIATNLVRDHRRRPQPVRAASHASHGDDEVFAAGIDGDQANRLARRIDVSRALEQLKPRDRSMLWLAYAHGWSHEEIAATLGVKKSSLKALMHRARLRLVTLLVNPKRRGGAS